jgi:formylglycine-generating enzyme required for sulfatase activity
MKLPLLVFFAGLFLLGMGALAWKALDLPPVRLVLSHGFPPAGGPTGRVKEIEGVRFVEIGTGYFRMGSWFGGGKGDALGRICKALHLPWGKQPQVIGNEVPVRWVEIREPHWIAVTELTNLQYERFDPEHGRHSPGDDDPVTGVSFEDAQDYCGWLAKRSGLPVRLPSEAEWENVCRSGSQAEYCFGDDGSRLGEYAWFGVNSGGRAHAVGTRLPNAWGLHDLHGNVWEWCRDTYHEDYGRAPKDASAWTEGGWEMRPGASPYRVFRGGGSSGAAVGCRSAFRRGYDPSIRWNGLGFRPALWPSAP